MDLMLLLCACKVLGVLWPPPNFPNGIALRIFLLGGFERAFERTSGPFSANVASHFLSQHGRAGCRRSLTGSDGGTPAGLPRNTSKKQEYQ